MESAPVNVRELLRHDKDRGRIGHDIPIVGAKILSHLFSLLGLCFHGTPCLVFNIEEHLLLQSPPYPFSSFFNNKVSTCSISESASPKL
ncbi:hypothetical protein V6N11_035513 [Hibiscus sabdariffa]|uniref:Uncharacterized protein n=2 Tax=Hibiscus sabdariffa TaxID=183260 RepID=A0ABR2R0L3_9ROSI